MQLAPIAEKLAQAASSITDYALLRDYCDMATGGELDCIQLDILTDMTTERLVKLHET